MPWKKHTRKHEETRMHSPSSSCENLFLKEKENTSTAGKLQQFVGDKINRTKIFYTCLLYMTTGFQGWIKGLFGPIFLDLQRITGASQEKCSWLIATYFAGQMISSPVGGMLYGKTNNLLTMIIAHIGSALIICCIPWCSLFSLMVIAHLVLGLLLGPTDTIANTEIFYIWEGKGKIFMQGLHLIYAFEGVLSPLLTAPFLLPPDVLSCGNSTVNDTVFINNQLIQNTAGEHFVLNTEGNRNSKDIFRSSGADHCSETKQSSQIYIPLSITGALALTVAVGFIALFCTSMTQTFVFEKSHTEQDPEMKTILPKFIKYGAIFALSVLLFLSAAIDYGHNTFLVSFLVKKMNWTKSRGSTLTSLVFLFDVIGRVFCLFLITVLLPEILMTFHCVLLVIVGIGFLISALFTVNIGIWIFGSLFGYARSILFPIVFIWANERLFPLTGPITSVFLIAWDIGIIINPVIMGYTMESFSDIWFCYVLLGESIILLGVCIICLIMTKVIVIYHGTPTV